VLPLALDSGWPQTINIKFDGQGFRVDITGAKTGDTTLTVAQPISITAPAAGQSIAGAVTVQIRLVDDLTAGIISAACQ
jgi:hypothetical protein